MVVVVVVMNEATTLMSIFPLTQPTHYYVLGILITHSRNETTRSVRSGMTLELDGEPYKVLHFSIMKQARGAAKTTIKFKNLMRGTTIENTYRSGEKFETAEMARTDAQFTYQEGVRTIKKTFCVVDWCLFPPLFGAGCFIDDSQQ
jgi:Elongation factor P (EF-P) KOW-like domain